MKIFIDSADKAQIQEAYELGIVDGVTTNPSLLAKYASGSVEGSHAPMGAMYKYLKDICKVVGGNPVSVEVLAKDRKTIVEEGKALNALHKNIVVKIPMTQEGVCAIKSLSKEKISTNCTLVFSEAQALLAAKVGASYVSPFVGRLYDRRQSGMKLVGNIQTIYQHYGFSTEVLVASVRSVFHVAEAAMLGAAIATCPYSIIKALYVHELTDEGLESFLRDYEKAFGSRHLSIPPSLPI